MSAGATACGQAMAAAVQAAIALNAGGHYLGTLARDIAQACQ